MLYKKSYILILGICVGEPIMLVMELARLGPLNKYLRMNCANVPTATITFYLYQVCEVCSLSVCICTRLLCVCGHA